MTLLGAKPLLTTSRLKTIGQHVLICQGDQDKIADWQCTEHVACTLPQAEFKLLVDTPHPFEKVNVDRLADEILTFIG